MKLPGSSRQMGLAEQAFWVVAIPFVIELVFALIVGSLLEQIQKERQDEIHSRELAEHIGFFMQAALDRGTVAFCRKLGDPDALQERFWNDARQAEHELRLVRELIHDHPREKAAIGAIIETKERLDRTEEAANFQFSEGTSPRAISAFRRLRDHMVECIRRIQAAIDETRVEQVQKQEKQVSLRRTLEWVLFAFMALNLIAAAVLAARFNSKAVKRLKILMDNTNRIASGQPLHLPIAGTDEIAELDANLRRMQGAIEEAKDREHAVTEHAVDIICELNKKLKFARINLAVSKLWGYDRDELLGRDIDVVVLKDDLQPLLAAFEEAATKNAITTVEARVRRKDRTSAYMRWSINSSPEDASIVCIVHDITAQKEIEQMKHDLVGMVSHDLRTPLSSLVITHELFSSGAYGDLSDEGLRNLNLASRNAGQLLLLVNNILDVEKLEAGQLDLTKEPVPINAMLEAAVQSVFQFADEHDIRIVMPTPNSVTIIGDKDKLTQVMANLLAFSIGSVERAVEARMSVTRNGSNVGIEMTVSGSAAEPSLAALHSDKDSATVSLDKQGAQRGTTDRPTESADAPSESVSVSLSKAIIEKLGGRVSFTIDRERSAVVAVTFENQSAELDSQTEATR